MANLITRPVPALFESLDPRLLFAEVVGGVLYVRGTPGDDVIVISAGKKTGQVVVRGEGDPDSEQTFSGIGAVKVRGGNGDDHLSVRGDVNLLPKSDGGRIVSSVRLLGGPGDDALIGNRHVRTEYDGGPGADRIDGAGWGILHFVGVRHGVHVRLADGKIYDDGTGSTDDVKGILEVYGTRYDDAIYGGRPLGDRGPNLQFLRGDKGDDLLRAGDLRTDLRGGSGNDSLIGGSMDDGLNGEAGDDLILGNGGRNRLMLFGGTRGAVVRLDRGVARDGFGGRDVFRDVQDIYGSAGNDTLAGDAANNEIHGLGGTDVIRGGAGKDQFYVDREGSLNSTVLGGDGKDFIRSLFDHVGTLDGGEGEDTFESRDPIFKKKPRIRVE